MKTFYVLVLAMFLPVHAFAQETFAPQPAASVVFADQLYVTRPVVIFADSEKDPSYIRQMELLARDYDDLAARDVILIIDTDPAAKTEWRLKLRPRGFSMVILDKDLKPVVRKPIPWDVREIAHAIDKLPTRRQELLEQAPAGG